MDTREWFTSLDPIDQRRVLEVMLHEARGESGVGMASVADVLRNRQLGSGKTLEDLTDPTQFTGFEFGGRQWTPEQYERAMSAVGLQTPVGNATHYYNPDKASPRWGKHMQDTTTVGNHVFGNLGTPQLDPFLGGPQPQQRPDPINTLLAQLDQQQPRASAHQKTRWEPQRLSAPLAPTQRPTPPPPLQSASQGLMGPTGFSFQDAIMRGFGRLV